MEDFELNSDINSQCEMDSMTIVNSRGGYGGRICGHKSNYALVTEAIIIKDHSLLLLLLLLNVLMLVLLLLAIAAATFFVPKWMRVFLFIAVTAVAKFDHLMLVSISQMQISGRNVQQR